MKSNTPCSKLVTISTHLGSIHAKQNVLQTPKENKFTPQLHLMFFVHIIHRWIRGEKEQEKGKCVCLHKYAYKWIYYMCIHIYIYMYTHIHMCVCVCWPGGWAVILSTCNYNNNNNKVCVCVCVRAHSLQKLLSVNQ